MDCVVAPLFFAEKTHFSVSKPEFTDVTLKYWSISVVNPDVYFNLCPVSTEWYSHI